MKINSDIYNHLSIGLMPKKRSTTHKSSALKEIYTDMARYNNKSPLYIVSLSDAKQSHMIQIKEAAITLQDVSDSFSDASSAVYDKKILHSSNEGILSGAFRSNRHTDLPDELRIEITGLAGEQSNVGHYVDADQRAIPAGSYAFDITTPSASAHFGLTVSKSDNNQTILDTIAKYINNRGIDINASILQEGNDIALMLSSAKTGIPNTTDGLYFTIADATDSAKTDTESFVDAFGLNTVRTRPTNSVFSINGEEHVSTSNHISINQTIELDFHKASKDPVTVQFLPDTEVAADAAKQFLDAYNSLVDLAAASGETQIGSRNLSNDISRIVSNHKEQLEAVGITSDENGHLVTDEASFATGIKDGQFAALFADTGSFKKDIASVSKRLSLDPIAYINKIMVSYPNAKNKYGISYTQSAYSGMMYNNYA
ncbi:MAG: hypothetical protein Q4D54_03315 [Eubacteriales bacterium]|nr:hypothetical protein [Eubacteriales bacterium]